MRRRSHQTFSRARVFTGTKRSVRERNSNKVQRASTRISPSTRAAFGRQAQTTRKSCGRLAKFRCYRRVSRSIPIWIAWGRCARDSRSRWGLAWTADQVPSSETLQVQHFSLQLYYLQRLFLKAPRWFLLFRAIWSRCHLLPSIFLSIHNLFMNIN